MPEPAPRTASPSEPELVAPARREGRPARLLALAGLTILFLLPFSGKAFNIDDPLFLWAARHIQTSPLDPYGFKVNWYGLTMPMSDVTKNPPLASYYIAGAATLLGWGERSLHVAFLIPALLVTLVTYLLAERLCTRPFLAASCTLATPVFLVSSSTLMSDTWMLALWLLSVHLWITGLRESSAVRLLLGSAFIALASVAKYYAMALIPLLFVYTLIRTRRPTRALAALLVPVALLGVYQWWTLERYGHGLLLDAAAYATERNAWTLDKLLIGLAFTGGCLGVVCLFTRWCMGGRLWGALALGSALLAMVRAVPLVETHGIDVTRSPWPGAPLFALFAAGGVLVVAIPVREMSRRRDAETWLLSLWLLGTLLFASVVNWTTNGRSILPLVPAAAILLVRSMSSDATGAPGRWATGAVLVSAALVALSVAWSDLALANSARDAARALLARYGGREERLLFEGHWGFQYYMEAGGAEPVDFRNTVVRERDLIVLPEDNTYVAPLPVDKFTLVESIEIPAGTWLTTLSSQIGAGFYADVLGPLPFGVGSIPPGRYRVLRPARRPPPDSR